MARIRTVKPEFWTAEQVMELTRDARLMFVGLWNFCDDAGIHPASTKTLKAEVFPADDIGASDVRRLIDECICQGLLIEYQVEDKDYWQVTGWHHQRIDQPTYKHPTPDGRIPEGAARRRSEKAGGIKQTTNVRGLFAEQSPNTSQSLAECSPPEGKGEEGKGINEAKASSVASNVLAPCPHQEILELFANELPSLAQPRVWNGAREKNLRSRWAWVLADLKKKDKPHGKAAGLEFFQRMFAYVSKSDFLMGRKTDWSCSLSWIVGSENFAKIIEGTYENKEAA